jgi:hypothetical protein
VVAVPPDEEPRRLWKRYVLITPLSAALGRAEVETSRQLKGLLEAPEALLQISLQTRLFARGKKALAGS